MTFDDVIKHFGGAAQAARKLGVKRQSVYRWQEEIPMLRQYQIEHLTGGALKADVAGIQEMNCLPKCHDAPADATAALLRERVA